MRRIVSKHEADKKKRRNQLIAGGILIAVMFLSVMGYAFQNSALGGPSNTGNNSTQTVNYNGINFQNVNGFWVLQSGNTRLVFAYNPNEVSSINLTGVQKVISDFSEKPLYIYYNNSGSQASNAESEISYNMKNFANSVQTGNISSLGSLGPNCALNTIIIQNGTQNVREDQNCIYIQGKGEDLIKSADSVMFKLLGIIK